MLREFLLAVNRSKRFRVTFFSTPGIKYNLLQIQHKLKTQKKPKARVANCVLCHIYPHPANHDYCRF